MYVAIIKYNMNGLKLTSNELDPTGYWSKALTRFQEFPTAGSQLLYPGPEFLALFEQNGYEMTEVEQWYAEEAKVRLQKHYPSQSCLKRDWMTQDVYSLYKGSTVLHAGSDTGAWEGAHLNHCLLFERRGFTGAALEQLKTFATKNTLIYKLIKMKPKWGFDFSMDYTDREGNVLEVLHYEYDGFNYNEIVEKQKKHESIFLSIDWDDAAKQLLKHKDTWGNMEFFEQSAWKCRFFGIDNERWKMVVWE